MNASRIPVEKDPFSFLKVLNLFQSSIRLNLVKKYNESAISKTLSSG